MAPLAYTANSTAHVGHAVRMGCPYSFPIDRARQFAEDDFFKDDVMLVITRKPDQAVVIGDEIQLTIVEVLSIGVLIEVQATPETRVEWKSKEGRHRHRWSNEDATVCMVLDRRGRISFDRTIHVTLIDIRTEKARLGIEAPRDIPVYRKEVHESSGRE